MTWVAAGVGAGVSALSGIAQIATSGKKKKERALEAQAANAPKYGGNEGIDKYYQQALEQANTSASQSALYKQGQNLANRNLAAGLGALSTRPGGQGAVAGLVQGASDTSMRNLAQAEAQKERRFGTLGQATQMKAGEDWKKFQINQQQPWETKYNLLAAKAARAAEQQQAGFQNISSAASGLLTTAASQGKKSTTTAS